MEVTASATAGVDSHHDDGDVSVASCKVLNFNALLSAARANIIRQTVFLLIRHTEILGNRFFQQSRLLNPLIESRTPRCF